MTTPASRLADLTKRGCDLLGSRYAILGGAMSWVSESSLVAAISNAGAFGVIACSAMPPEALAAEIDETRTKTTKPFGVNLILMHPKIDDLIDLCGEKKVTHLVLAGGMPKQSHIDRAKSHGIRVLAFAPALAIARKLVKMGVDGIIIEGMEAGGHIGPVALSVLAQEILPHITEVPVFVAGGLGRGEAMVAFLEMGASGCQLGTLFVCAEESIAHPKFKEAFIKAAARDAVPSVQYDPDFPVIPVRAIANKATTDFTRKQKEVVENFRAGKMDKHSAQLEIEHFWAGALRRAVIDGDTENGSLMAGQSVGMVTGIRKTEEIIGDFIEQAENFLKTRNMA